MLDTATHQLLVNLSNSVSDVSSKVDAVRDRVDDVRDHFDDKIAEMAKQFVTKDELKQHRDETDKKISRIDRVLDWSIFATFTAGGTVIWDIVKAKFHSP